MPASKSTKKGKVRAEGELELRGKATLSIKAAEGDKPAERRFEMVLYTGEPLNLEWWSDPVVIDMAGIVTGSGVFPILDDHGGGFGARMREQVVGQSESAAVENGQLILRGKMIEVNDAAKSIIAMADAGFSWQTSIGANTSKKDFVAEGSTVNVNGRDYEGPVFIARQTELREGSFVVIGADKKTSVVIASGKKGKAMTFAAYCATKGYEDITKMTAAEKAEMEAAYAASDGISAEDDTEEEDDEEEDDDEDKKKKEEAAAKLNIRASAKPPKGGDTRQAVEEYRKAQAKEERRIRAIRDLTASAPELKTVVTDDAGKERKVNLRERAIAAGWSKNKTELEHMRAIRAGGGNVEVPNTWYSPSTPELSEAVIEAAVFQSIPGFQLFDDDFYSRPQGERGPMKDRDSRQIRAELKRRYPEQVQDTAHKLFKGRIGLQQMLTVIAGQNGYRGRESISDENLGVVAEHCMRNIRAEGSSTMSVSNVTANVLNKFLGQGYLFTERAWPEIAAIRSVKDFKPTKLINLFGDVQFKDVGTSGELENATLQDQAFANQVKSSGRINTIPRTAIINDDLGAFGQVPMLMGRGAGLKLNYEFWKLFLNPGYDDGGTTNFFAATHTITNQAGNSNYASGAGSVLGDAGLTAATLLFDKQIDPMGYPLGLDAEILLYPADLQTAALTLMNAEFNIMDSLGSTSSAKVRPNTNLWKGRFKPVKSRYLSNSAFTGYSTTAWYLLANPGLLPVMEVAFLGGQEMPTVQNAGPDFQFNILGISTRAFFDMGVNMQNFRGAVKSAGA